MQQEIAEELERERKRNKKELAALQQTNKNLIRQKEEAQRVVVHLRSLISGQTHHMEHIVRSLHTAPELSDAQEDGENGQDDSDDRSVTSDRSLTRSHRLSGTRSYVSLRRVSRKPERPYSPAGSVDSEKVTPEMENRFFASPAGGKGKRLSDQSLVDVADRHLRDKTDAIANIIRNISEQCAAAVEGLQLAHNAEQELDMADGEHEVGGSTTTGGSEMGERSEVDFNDASSTLTPYSVDPKRSSIPPTPDLYHNNRSSTAMSINSISTANDRVSQQYSSSGLKTKIVTGDDESERGSMLGSQESPITQKMPNQEDVLRPATARIVS